MQQQLDLPMLLRSAGSDQWNAMQGSIPYVPVLRAPFYVWVGRPRPGAGILTEARVEAPPCFPPTFLYTQSWEDPRADMQVDLLPSSQLFWHSNSSVDSRKVHVACATYMCAAV